MSKSISKKTISKPKIKKPAKKPAVAAKVSVKKAVHYTEKYLLAPQHPITINLIGCGGTGSQALNSLARMHSALVALGHPGLFVYAIDPDKVTEANMGRQLFSAADIDSYKSEVLIARINRFFGTDWEAIQQLYAEGTKINPANVTISCVDSGAARKSIRAALNAVADTKSERPHFQRSRWPHYQVPYYWMDFGNMSDRGQVVIGSLQPISQPKESEFSCKTTLPSIEKYHPDIFKDNNDDDQGPSCSLAEALQKQDLFINTNLANMGLGILWKMFREARIFHHGLYVNLNSMSVNPIKVA